MALLLSLRGSVSLYQGEQLGLTEVELGWEQLRDPFGKAYWPEFRGRDGSRTPIPWRADAANSGFTSAEPWLPVPASHRPFAVDQQDIATDSLLNAFRRFIAWRRQQPALIWGWLEPLDLPEPLVGFVRDLEGQRILALFNLSDASVTTSVAHCGAPQPMAESGCAAEIRDDVVRLPPFGTFFGVMTPVVAPSREPVLAAGR
jgi:alpha-glucosidase